MLVIRDPFFGLSRFEDELFDEPWLFRAEEETCWPSVDVYEGDKDIKLRADLPGINPDEIKIELKDNILTLHGERKLDKEENEKGYCRLERSHGAFSRSFTLGDGLDGNGIEAKYTDGVLTITVPRKEGTARREIKVVH